MLSGVLGYFGSDFAIDLGTANTLVYIPGRGIVLEEPSVVAIREQTNGDFEIIAVGEAAKNMMGRTPDNIHIIRPLRNGTIADDEATKEMIKYFISRVYPRKSLTAPRIMICVPPGATPVERAAVFEAAFSAGARKVYIISEPIAAAIGAHLPVNEPRGTMVVDIGGGTTDIAVLSLGGVIYTRTLRVAGDAMDEAIINYVRRKHALLVGETSAELIKKEAGTVMPEACLQQGPEACAPHAPEAGYRQELEAGHAGGGNSAQRQDGRANGVAVDVFIKGRNLRTGLPTEIKLSQSDIARALARPVEAISEAVQFALEELPPELAADIQSRGVFLTGGGAMLNGLAERLREATGVRFNIPDDPLRCVAEGTGLALEHLDDLEHLLFDSR